MGIAFACELCPTIIPIPKDMQVKHFPICPSCAEGTMIIVSDSDKEENNLTKSDDIISELPLDKESFNFMPEPISSDEISEFINQSFPGSNLMESELISDRINRTAPIFLATMVLADMKKQGIDVTEDKFIVEFGNIGKKYRNSLRKLEDHEDIPRGLRLSDGFPKESGDHLRTWIRMYIGGNINDKSISSAGLVQKLGILDVDNRSKPEGPRQMSLRENSRDLIGINLPKGDDMKFLQLNTYGQEVKLPVWFKASDVEIFLKFIATVAKEEMEWMKFILQQTEGPGGKNTEDIINFEIDLIQRNQTPSRRWSRHEGKGIKSKIESELDENLDEESREEKTLQLIEKRIKPTVISTLGRLKELGLIYPVKKGRRTYYKATGLGQKWIKQFDRIE